MLCVSTFSLQLLLAMLAMNPCLHALAVHITSYCHHCGMLPTSNTSTWPGTYTLTVGFICSFKVLQLSSKLNLGSSTMKKNSGPDSNMFPDCTAQNKRTNDCVNDSYGLLGTEQHVSWNTAQCKCEHSCRLTNLQPAWSIVKLHRELTELTAMNTNLWFKTGSTMIWKALYKEGSKRFE